MSPNNARTRRIMMRRVLALWLSWAKRPHPITMGKPCFVLNQCKVTGKRLTRSSESSDRRRRFLNRIGATCGATADRPPSTRRRERKAKGIRLRCRPDADPRFAGCYWIRGHLGSRCLKPGLPRHPHLKPAPCASSRMTGRFQKRLRRCSFENQRAFARFECP